MRRAGWKAAAEVVVWGCTARGSLQMKQSWEVWIIEGVMGWVPTRRNSELEGKIAMVLSFAQHLMLGLLRVVQYAAKSGG